MSESGLILNKIVCEYCRREIEEPLVNEIELKKQEIKKLDELIKDLGKIPTVHKIVHRFEKVGISYNDLVILIQAKTKLSRENIRKILEVLKGYEMNIQ